MTIDLQDFTGMRALFINCTLKRSPELSHTQGLIDISSRIMESTGSRWKLCVRLTMRSRPASGPTCANTGGRATTGR